MSMNIDKSLDEIVAGARKAKVGARKQQQTTAARGVGARRGGAGGAQQTTRRVANVPGVARNNVPTGPANGGHLFGAGPGLEGVVGDKIIISNLPEDVTEIQIKELFTSTVGPLKSASLSYDSKGKSKGVATVQFVKAADATKAYQQYNKRLIDGKRPMKVEIIVDPSRVPAQPLHARLGVAPNMKSANTVAAAGGSARQARNTPTAPAAAANTAGGAARGGRAGGRGGRGGRKGGNDRGPKPTLESLDAEMSDYQATVSAPVV